MDRKFRPIQKGLLSSTQISQPNDNSADEALFAAHNWLPDLGSQSQHFNQI
jgi:hypothetical protein